jgi:hypothetical protein
LLPLISVRKERKIPEKNTIQSQYQLKLRKSSAFAIEEIPSIVNSGLV